jgi:hypothetical protein
MIPLSWPSDPGNTYGICGTASISFFPGAPMVGKCKPVVRLAAAARSHTIRPLATGNYYTNVPVGLCAYVARGRIARRPPLLRSQTIEPGLGTQFGPGNPWYWQRPPLPFMFRGRPVLRWPIIPRSLALPPLAMRTYYSGMRGLYRVFNAAAYRIYLTTGSPPIEGSTPWATSASLPVTPTAALADGTYYLSVSYFNGVLDSGFLPIGPAGETYLRLVVSSGATLPAPPCDPISLSLTMLPGGVVRVVGLAVQTAATPPALWKILYQVDGAAALEVDVPFMAGPLSVLDASLPAQANGASVGVTISTERNDGTLASPTWTESVNSISKAIVVLADGPTAPLGDSDYPGPLPQSVEVG